MPGHFANNLPVSYSLPASTLAAECYIPGHPEKCTLNLAILSGPEFGLLEGHSRSAIANKKASGAKKVFTGSPVLVTYLKRTKNCMSAPEMIIWTKIQVLCPAVF